jgi:hypothetical protein
MRKKRKITDAEIRASLGEEFYERHERTQALLAERMAYHRRKIEEERGAAEKRG